MIVQNIYYEEPKVITTTKYNIEYINLGMSSNS